MLGAKDSKVVYPQHVNCTKVFELRTTLTGSINGDNYICIHCLEQIGSVADLVEIDLGTSIATEDVAPGLRTSISSFPIDP